MQFNRTTVLCLDLIDADMGVAYLQLQCSGAGKGMRGCDSLSVCCGTSVAYWMHAGYHTEPNFVVFYF